MKKRACKLLIGCSLLMLVGCGKAEELKHKQELFEVEYGQTISTNVTDYFENKEDVLADVKLETEIENEEDKEYPALGEYTLSFIRGDDTENKTEVKVVVKDTVAPVFNDLQEEYEVEHGGSLNTDMFVKNITDIDSVEITINDEEVDYNSASTYTATLTATDKTGNKTEQSITVIVAEKEVEEVESVPNGSNNSANGNNTSNGGSYTPPSNTGNSGSSSNSGNSQTPPPIVEKPAPPVEEKPIEPPVCKLDVGNSGMLFDTEAEAIAWADNYCLEDGYETVRGYVGWSTCGKFTIDFKLK